jgi:hypothetical protein
MVLLCEFLSHLIPMNHPTDTHISLLLFDPFQVATNVIEFSILPLLLTDFNDVGIMLIYKKQTLHFVNFCLVLFNINNQTNSHTLYTIHSISGGVKAQARNSIKNDKECC